MAQRELTLDLGCLSLGCLGFGSLGFGGGSLSSLSLGGGCLSLASSLSLGGSGGLGGAFFAAKLGEGDFALKAAEAILEAKTVASATNVANFALELAAKGRSINATGNGNHKNRAIHYKLASKTDVGTNLKLRTASPNTASGLVKLEWTLPTGPGVTAESEPEHPGQVSSGCPHATVRRSVHLYTL